MRVSFPVLPSAPRRGISTVALIGALATGGLAEVSAQEVAPGKVAAAIRSSGQPCARVIEQKPVGESEDGTVTLEVRCNSGLFEVKVRDGVPSEVSPLP